MASKPVKKKKAIKSPQYKVWMEVERYNPKTRCYEDLSRSGEAESVPLGVYDSLEEACRDMADLNFARGIEGARRLQFGT